MGIGLAKKRRAKGDINNKSRKGTRFGSESTFNYLPIQYIFPAHLLCAMHCANKIDCEMYIHESEKSSACLDCHPSSANSCVTSDIMKSF